ncbi:OLC1v1004125C1 [Oldenlandia corymbosa var. corymbosa]|uniref:OLC1v1004125C1 n=1 Tax=Oldenlandia corymbosa var. corymbosa TaxID=529605 RepID=A0AAV1DEK2_OLDCO|nr:OLC1v1004125C1 [Oldenlandia corymbosa var. corymbosa]
MPSHRTIASSTATTAGAGAANAQTKSSRNQLVSSMIKQGFLSDPFLSPTPSPPSAHHQPFSLSRLTAAAAAGNATTLSPPPSFANGSPNPPRSSPSPTLFEMMTEEQARDSKRSIEARLKLQDRVFKVLEDAPFQDSAMNSLGPGDVKLAVRSCDGFCVSMEVHRRVLAGRSRFFAEKLQPNGSQMVSVEILDCDDVEVCSAVLFDDGILACLEYLEAVPWSEDEEEKVVSQLGDLQLCEPLPNMLQRVVAETSTSPRADDIFLKLLTGVLQAKDDKARREMKSLISRLFKQESSDSHGYSNGFDISKDTMYHVCHRCLSSLILSLSEGSCVDENRQDRGFLMSEIARAADNMQWVVDILIDRKMGDEFVKLWADQKELAVLHSKIPTMYRHEISRITAQLCIAIGRGHILVPKDARYSLLTMWLEALYEDFGWMKRASRSIDKKLIEEGLSQTILTLPLSRQQSILLNWFDRFLNKGDDCPNIQRAFEVWWRRSFIKQYALDSQLQITVYDYAS